MASAVEKTNLTSGTDGKLFATGASDDLTTQTGYRQGPCRDIFYNGAVTVVMVSGNSLDLPDPGAYTFLPIQCIELTSGTNVVVFW